MMIITFCCNNSINNNDDVSIIIIVIVIMFLRGADPLREVAGRYTGVLLGSYPATDEGALYRVKIQLESRDPAALREAAEAVDAALPTFRNLP